MVFLGLIVLAPSSFSGNAVRESATPARTPVQTTATVEPETKGASAPLSKGRVELAAPALAVAEDPKEATPKIEEPESKKDEEPRERASSGKLAMAQGRGSEALEQLLESYPRDGKILKALVLAHASRADTLDLSVKTISRLFQVEPDFSSDADVLFILKKGLLGQGDAHKLALDIVRDQMRIEGGELVYQLLTENPKQQSRLKNIFFELRKEGRVSSATAIAYDLRYATSCQGRLAFLERAEAEGDLRSVQQLQALSTAPKSCGWGWRTCKPVCPAEAQRFKESIDLIQSRLARATATRL